MNYEEISFGIISYAGDAFATMRQAINYAKKGEIEKSEATLEEARKTLLLAHNEHTKLIAGEANGVKPEYSIILSHAQDTMMNTILFETITEEIIEIYKNK
ncbi:MAG: PTS lactose/cellobiose transporter subunit IIA [Clostridium sp.]